MTFRDKALSKAIFLDLEGFRRELHLLLLSSVKELNFDAESKQQKTPSGLEKFLRENRKGTNLERSIFKWLCETGVVPKITSLPVTLTRFCGNTYSLASFTLNFSLMLVCIFGISGACSKRKKEKKRTRGLFFVGPTKEKRVVAEEKKKKS